MSRNDPDVPYRYQIEIDGISNVRFTDASGLKSSTAISSIREGGNNVYEYAMVDGNKFEDLIIKKGFYSSGSEFFLWMKDLHIKSKKIKRKNISLIILNDKYEETGRYNRLLEEFLHQVDSGRWPCRDDAAETLPDFLPFAAPSSRD